MQHPWLFVPGFITYRCTPPHRWASACLWSGAFRCAGCRDAQRCHTEPVTTPSVCLKERSIICISDILHFYSLFNINNPMCIYLYPFARNISRVRVHSSAENKATKTASASSFYPATFSATIAKLKETFMTYNTEAPAS